MEYVKIMKKLSLDEYKIDSATYRGNNILTLDFNQAIPFLDYLTQKDESLHAKNVLYVNT